MTTRLAELLRTAQGDEGRAALEALAAERPHDAEALCAAALACRREGDRRAARRWLLTAITRLPDHPAAYGLFGDLLVAERQAPRAELYCQMAWQLDPGSPDGPNRLLLYYHDQGLAYAAQQMAHQSLALDPDQPAVAAALAELEALHPVQPVTAAVVSAPASAAELPRVIEALAGQSHPVAQVLVVDLGLPAGALDGLSLPVQVLAAPGASPAAARNRALAACSSEFVALLEADAVPDPHWLERLMLPFDAERLITAERQAGHDPYETGYPLAAAAGHLLEQHAHSLADEWRARHLLEHYVGGWSPAVPWFYPSNALLRRSAILGVGGWDEAQPVADAELGARLLAAHRRMTYEEHAVCRRWRRQRLPEVLAAAWAHQTPYHWEVLPRFTGCRTGDVVAHMAHNRVQQTVDDQIDAVNHLPHLAYPTFLALPWRLLGDFQRAAAAAAGAHEREQVAQTHAAVFVSLFPLLRDWGLDDELLRLIHGDLFAAAPADPELAALCDWPAIEATLAAAAGGGGPQPLDLLIDRDAEAARELLQRLAVHWSETALAHLDELRASARRRRSELLLEGAPEADVVLVPAGGGAAALGAVAVRLGSAGVATDVVDAAEHLPLDQLLARLAGLRPAWVVLTGSLATLDADADLALAVKEAVPGEVHVALLGCWAGAAAAVRCDHPHLDAVAETADELLAALGWAGADPFSHG